MKNLRILLICIITLFFLTACTTSEESSENLSENTNLSEEDTNFNENNTSTYNSFNTAGAYNHAVSPSGDYIQFTLVHPAVGLFIEDINSGMTGDLQFYFTSADGDWGSLFLDGNNGNYEASFQYINGSVNTNNGDLTIDVRGEAISFTLSANEGFDPYELVELGYNINVDGLNVYSQDITENIQINGAEFTGEDSSIIKDHKFVGEFYLERPDYFNLSPSSEESFLTIEATNISFVYNGQNFSIDYTLSEQEANSGEHKIEANSNGIDFSITLSDSNPYIIIEDDLRIFLNESIYQSYLEYEDLSDERFINE